MSPLRGLVCSKFPTWRMHDLKVSTKQTSTSLKPLAKLHDQPFDFKRKAIELYLSVQIVA